MDKIGSSLSSAARTTVLRRDAQRSLRRQQLTHSRANPISTPTTARNVDSDRASIAQRLGSCCRCRDCSNRTKQRGQSEHSDHHEHCVSGLCVLCDLANDIAFEATRSRKNLLGSNRGCCARSFILGWRTRGFASRARLLQARQPSSEVEIGAGSKRTKRIVRVCDVQTRWTVVAMS